MIQFQENPQTEGRMQGQIALFYRTLTATAGGPVKKIGSENIRGIYFTLAIIRNAFTQAMVPNNYISTGVHIY